MITIAKLPNNKIVEIVKVAETVGFSDDKGWLLIASEPGKKNSLAVRWVKASDAYFTWVKEFTF